MAARLAPAVATGAASVLPGFLVGALALQIRSDLDVRVEAVAAGVSVFFFAGALSAGWGGRLADHVGAVRAMRWCVLITAACLFAAALLAESLVVLLLVLAAAGVSNAVCQPAINLFVSEQIPADRQGVGFGVKQSGIPAAILVSGLALPVLAIPLGWRATFALCAVGPLAIGLALPREGSVHVSRRPASRRPSQVLPRNCATWRQTAATCCSTRGVSTSTTRRCRATNASRAPAAAPCRVSTAITRSSAGATSASPRIPATWPMRYTRSTLF